MIRNKTIVITGASSGIGRTVLEMLAAKENKGGRGRAVRKGGGDA